MLALSNRRSAIGFKLVQYVGSDHLVLWLDGAARFEAGKNHIVQPTWHPYTLRREQHGSENYGSIF